MQRDAENRHHAKSCVLLRTEQYEPMAAMLGQHEVSSSCF